jgi:hypothetical protein
MKNSTLHINKLEFQIINVTNLCFFIVQASNQVF